MTRAWQDSYTPPGRSPSPPPDKRPASESEIAWKAGQGASPGPHVLQAPVHRPHAATHSIHATTSSLHHAMSVARTEMAERQALGQTLAMPTRSAHQGILQNAYPPRGEAKPQSLANGADTSWPQRIGGQKGNTLGIATGGGGGGGMSGAGMIKPPPTARCYLLFKEDTSCNGYPLDYVMGATKLQWQQLLVTILLGKRC
eukprot:s2482_g3.t1